MPLVQSWLASCQKTETDYSVILMCFVGLQVCRDDSARAAVTSKHSYCVQVAAGTDCVLMIAVALAIEDLYHK